MKGKTMLWIVLAIIALVLGIGTYIYLELMSGPMYQPGAMREQTAAATIDGDYFQMPDGAKLFYRSQGEGEPVLMLHGGPGYPFTAAWPSLEGIKNHRFIYYDQRGCGLSSRPIKSFIAKNLYDNMKTLETSLGIGAQLADIEAIRRAYGVERITLVGHSFGAFLAALYAAEYPDHVAKLLLIAPAAVMKLPASGEDLYGTIASKLSDPQDQAEFATWKQKIFDFPTLLGMDENNLSVLYARFIPFYAKVTGTNLEAAMAAPVLGVGGFLNPALFLSLGKKHDFRPFLAKIQAPCLILAASGDPAASESAIREQYLSAIPGAMLKFLPGSSHFIYDDKQTDFSSTVAEFLK